MRYVLERGVLGPSLGINVFEIVDIEAHPRRAVVRATSFAFGTKLTALLNAPPRAEDEADYWTAADHDRICELLRDLLGFAEPQTIGQEHTINAADAATWVRSRTQ